MLPTGSRKCVFLGHEQLLPKISQLASVADALLQQWPLSWLGLSEDIPSFPIPLYNSSKAEHPKFANFTGFILLCYSTSAFS